MGTTAKGKTQKDMLVKLLQLLLDRFEEKELDEFYISEEEGWEKVKIVFRPKES